MMVWISFAVHRYLAPMAVRLRRRWRGPLLADALTLVFPVVFANGIAEDLIFADDFEDAPDEEDVLARLNWADSFWLWLDRTADTLAQTWESSA